MPLSSCSSGLVVASLVALLLLPAQYYLPESYLGGDELVAPAPAAPAHAQSPLHSFWTSFELVHFPTLDLVLTASLLLLVVFIYVCEWVERKLIERRIIKLNQYLGTRVERLREWDAKQEELESTLKMVQNATSEYNLLLYLLLRQHRCLAHAQPPPQHNCFFDKEFDTELL